MKHMQPSLFLHLLFLVMIGLATNRCNSPIEEEYKPDQPIEFPHDIHVSKGIDCKYCHNPKIDGKNDGIPSAKVCMKCHKEERESAE